MHSLDPAAAVGHVVQGRVAAYRFAVAATFVAFIAILRYCDVKCVRVEL